MKEKALAELEKALAAFGKSIAYFPVGAVSINDLKPIQEKIQDMRESLQTLNAEILMLRAKTHAQRSSNLSQASEEDIYNELQEKIAQCTINNLATECCLQNSTTDNILEDSENSEISETFRNILEELFSLDDKIMNFEKTRSDNSAKEIELKFQLQKSLSEFKEFLKQQESIRKKKLEETNPEIAKQKEYIQKRLQKVNIMKRLVTNLLAASSDVVKDNPKLQDAWQNHRELLSIDMIQDMAKNVNS